MANNNEKTFRIIVDYNTANENLEKIKAALNRVNTETKDLRKNQDALDKTYKNNKGAEEYVAQTKENTEKQAELRREYIGLTAQRAKAAKEVKALATATVAEKGSIDQLSAHLEALKLQYKSLGTEGQNSAQRISLQKEINETGAALNKLKADMAPRSGGGLIGSIFKANILTKTIGLFGELVGKAKEFVTEGIAMAQKAKGVQTAFNALNRPDLLKNLREATRGTVTDLTLMKNAVKANDFNVPLDKLGTLLKFVQQRAREGGEDVEELTNKIITGIGKKSPKAFTELGIAADRVRAEFKKTGDFAGAIENIANEELGKMSISATNAAEVTATKWENAKLRVGQAFKGMGDWWSKLSGSIADGVAALAGDSRTMSERFADQSKKVADLNVNLAPLLQRYNDLRDRTSLSNKEQDEMRSIISKIASVIPGAITQFDKYGNAIDISTSKAWAYIKAQKLILQQNNKDAIKQATKELKEAQKELSGIETIINSDRTYDRTYGGGTGAFSSSLTTEQLNDFRQKQAELIKIVKEKEETLNQLNGTSLEDHQKHANDMEVARNNFNSMTQAQLEEYIKLYKDAAKEVKAAQEQMSGPLPSPRGVGVLAPSGNGGNVAIPSYGGWQTNAPTPTPAAPKGPSKEEYDLALQVNAQRFGRSSDGGDAGKKGVDKVAAAQKEILKLTQQNETDRINLENEGLVKRLKLVDTEAAQKKVSLEAERKEATKDLRAGSEERLKLEGAYDTQIGLLANKSAASRKEAIKSASKDEILAFAQTGEAVKLSAEEQAEYQKRLAEVIQDKQAFMLSLMADGQDKERAQLEFNYQKMLIEAKKNGVDAIEVERWKQQGLEKIRKKSAEGVETEKLADAKRQHDLDEQLIKSRTPTNRQEEVQQQKDILANDLKYLQNRYEIVKSYIAEAQAQQVTLGYSKEREGQINEALTSLGNLQTEISGLESKTKQTSYMAKALGLDDESIEQIKQAAFDLASQVANTIADVQKQSIDRQLKAEQGRIDGESQKKKKALDDQRSRGLISERLYQEGLEKIDKDAEQQKEAAERDAFEKKKQVDTISAIINTALSITQALASLSPPASYVAAAVSAAMGAVQIATIQAQQYKYGGIVPVGTAGDGISMGQLKGPSHAQGGIRIYAEGSNKPLAEMEGDEILAVVKKESANEYLPQLSRINQKTGGKKFALGGVAYTPTNWTVPRPAALPNYGGRFLEQSLSGQANIEALQNRMLALTESINSRIDNIKVQVMESEITETQDRKKAIVAQATF